MAIFYNEYTFHFCFSFLHNFAIFFHEFVQFSLPNFDKPLIKIILLTVKKCFLKPTNVAILLCMLFQKVTGSVATTVNIVPSIIKSNT